MKKTQTKPGNLEPSNGMNLDQQTAIYNKQATSHIQYVGTEQY